MFNLFRKGSQQPPVRNPPPAVEKIVEPVIGEPVVSIIKEMENIDNWQIRVSFSRVSVTLRHKQHDLSLSFITYDCGRSFKLRDCKWATPDEAAAIAAALKVMMDTKQQIEKEYEHMHQQIEREKYMVFVKEKIV